MAKSLKEVLLQSGLSQDQIDALDAKVMNSLGGVLTTAEQAQADALAKQQEATTAAAKAESDRKAAEESAAAAKVAQEAAELGQRSSQEFWNNVYAPGMAAADAEKARLAKVAADAQAEAAYYKAQRESYLETLGIKPDDAPVFTPAANATPVADPNKTPGTPTYTINDVRDGLGATLGTLTDIQWKYQSLYGKPMPISPTELVRQSEANKFKDPATYASQIFKFAEKDAEIRQAAAKAHDDEIGAKAAAAKEEEWKAKLDAQTSEFAAKERKMAEQISTHPDMHLPPGSAKFTDLKRAQSAGERPDPTRMTPEARLKLTQEKIHQRLEERQQAAAA